MASNAAKTAQATQTAHTERVKHVEREDLRLFLNACLSATAQAEREHAADEQRLALQFLHAYMRVNYRELYARMAALPINDYNRQQIVYGLLRYPESYRPNPDPDLNPLPRENRLIFSGLLALPVHRVYKLFAQLAEQRVNNRRTRALIYHYLQQRNNLSFDLIKYRRLLRKILRHVHYPLSEEAYTFLFHKAWRQRVYTDPLLETFRQAHFSEQAIYQLPFTIAEGLAQRKQIPRERFLKQIAPRLSVHEAWRLQNTLGNPRDLKALQPEKMTLMDLVLYGLAQPAEGQAAACEGLERYFAHRRVTLAERQCFDQQHIVAVLDNSFSTVGSRERSRRPLATALVLHLYLQWLSTQLRLQYQGFWTHAVPSDFAQNPFCLCPVGPTGLAHPLIAALQTRPDGVLFVSDGAENYPARGVEWVLRQLKIEALPWLLHLNPVWNPVDYQPRELAAGVVTLGVRDIETVPLLLHFGRFFRGGLDMPTLIAGLEQRQ